MTERAVRARVESLKVRIIDNHRYKHILESTSLHGFERPSRIVVALRLRKSAARVTPCFVGHRSKKQLSIVFRSLTGSGAPKKKKHHARWCFFLFPPKEFGVRTVVNNSLNGC